jgi:hypothetical protein
MPRTPRARSTARLGTIDDDAVAECLECARDIANAELLMERYADAAATSARGLALARRAHRAPPLSSLLIARAGALDNLLDLDGALGEIEAAEESARLHGLPHVLIFVLWQRALIDLFHGQALEAELAAAEVERLIARQEPSELTRTGACVMAAIRAEHDPERSLRAMQEAAGDDLTGIRRTRRQAGGRACGTGA